MMNNIVLMFSQTDVNHDREGISNSFKLELSAFTEVIQAIEALTFSSN